ATILVTNNFVNVGIIILSSFITNSLIDFSNAPTIGFMFQVIVITFIILLFGEILPKVYASQYRMRFAHTMAYPLIIIENIVRPLNSLLISSTSIIKKRFDGKQNISIDELSEAINITSENIPEEKKILKGIVKFGSIDVKEIMKARIDVVAVNIEIKYKKLLSIIVESDYSRIPVYEETFDNVKGVLYVKDLLPFINNDDEFEWQKLIKPPYFVPETKKIDDLLEEFQKNKIHMAIVIDEYGGTSGIITMEDIIEEIVGEINDEKDAEEFKFHKIDNHNYIFEGKTLLNDFYKITYTDDEFFDEIKGESESLAGLLLEIKGEMPKKGEIINYKQFEFTIDTVDNRRIKKIKVKIIPSRNK
ncbi:gliding motility-associated protein GldE, partial [Bacteroidota bacterium]